MEMLFANRPLAAESLVLSLADGIGGVALAHAGLPALLAIAPPDLPRSGGIAVNNVVLLFSFGLCLLTVILCNLLPAWSLARIEAGAGLHDSRRGSSSGPGVRRLRGALVMVQFSLAIVLLTGTGLFLRSFLLLNAVDRGFDTTHLLIYVPLPYEKYQERMRGQAFFDEALQRVEGLPGVVGAATGSAVFDRFRGNAPNQHIVVEGRTPGDDPSLHARNVVSEGYFRVLGIPLRQGRLFSREDAETAPGGAVINEKMARQFWPSEDAVGRDLNRFFQAWLESGSRWSGLPEMSSTTATELSFLSSIVQPGNGTQ